MVWLLASKSWGPYPAVIQGHASARPSLKNDEVPCPSHLCSNRRLLLTQCNSSTIPERAVMMLWTEVQIRHISYYLHVYIYHAFTQETLRAMRLEYERTQSALFEVTNNQDQALGSRQREVRVQTDQSCLAFWHCFLSDRKLQSMAIVVCCSSFWASCRVMIFDSTERHSQGWVNRVSQNSKEACRASAEPRPM